MGLLSETLMEMTTTTSITFRSVTYHHGRGVRLNFMQVVQIRSQGRQCEFNESVQLETNKIIYVRCRESYMKPRRTGRINCVPPPPRLVGIGTRRPRQLYVMCVPLCCPAKLCTRVLTRLFYDYYYYF